MNPYPLPAHPANIPHPAGLQRQPAKRWVTVTDYRGTYTEVHVPGKIEGIPVKALAKKTFLSRKKPAKRRSVLHLLQPFFPVPVHIDTLF